jgi:uncharacterized membrane protein YkoI
MKALTLASLLVIALATAAPVRADDDHERARAALEAGRVLPLGAVLARVERDYPGQVLEVELEDHHDQLVYKIKLLRADGAITKLMADALSGEVLSHRGRGPRDTEGDGDGHR